MFEQLKMSNKLKRQLGSAVSMLLTVALLVTGLPADLLGGIASVKAATFTANTNQQYVTLTYDEDGWVKDQEGLTESRVKKWDFSKNGPSGNSTINQNEQLYGIVVTSGSDVSYKKWDGSKTEGFCIGKTGSVAILLDDATTKVEVGFNLYTNSGSRKINIGGVDVFQTAKNSDLTVDGTLNITDDDTYGHYLKIEGVSNGDGYSAEGDTKFNTLTITETRPVSDPNPSNPTESSTPESSDPSESTDPTDPSKPDDGDDEGSHDGIDAGTYDFVNDYGSLDEINQVVGLNVSSFTKHDSHGLQTTGNGGKITLKLSQEARITINQCQYGSTPEGGVTSTSGVVKLSSETDAKDGGSVYVITGATGETEITVAPYITGQSAAYVHSIKVEYGEFNDEPEGSTDGLDEGTYTFGLKTEEEVKAIDGLKPVGAFADYGNKHGFKANSATSALELNLKGSATITVLACAYGVGDLTSSSGEVASADVSEGSDGTGREYTVVGAKGDKEDGSGTVKLTLGNGAYIHSLSVIYDIDPETLDTAKADVWDFGAETVEGANNLLTADIINSTVYPGVVGGSTGVTIPGSFTFKDTNGKEAVRFVTDKTNNRYRTTNKAITRYDDKSLTRKDADGNVEKTYTGYLYSNNAGTEDTRMEIYLYEGDTLTLALGSNGTDASYILRNFRGETCGQYEYKSTLGVGEAVFYAAENGWYKLICTNQEKLVCARVTRQHAPVVTVSGTIDDSQATGIPEGYGVAYTNKTTGKVTVMDKDGKSYTGKLRGGYEYKASLVDANGWVIDGDARFLDLTTVPENKTKVNDLTIVPVDQVHLSGTITNLTEEELGRVVFVFDYDEETYAYEPEISITDKTTGAYTLSVEKGVDYKVAALNVNDSTLKTTAIQKTADDANFNIEFEKKSVYDVTIKLEGFEEGANLDNAVVTFTNISETYSVTDEKKNTTEYPYSYTFSVKDGAMKLRDGQYSVKVTGLGNYAYVQAHTKDVKVNGVAVSNAPVPFKELNEGWDFAVLNSGNGGSVAIETISEVRYYAGLELSAKVNENKTYLLAQADDTIKIPGLKTGDVLTVSYCYAANFTINGGEAVTTNSGSTSTIESTVYEVTADGDVTIACPGQTYFCSIALQKEADKVEYAETIEVGTDKTYKTINAALAAVRKMDRGEENKRVTILIQPGNYEEMLDIDVPNVTLQNAAGANADIALTNSGADINDQTVRVTWYYGHGYTYYSQGPDCKYDAELLEVNKANGYASFTNPGSGTTNGSYWNATVTVQASGFQAAGIIFENSFNQYVSAASVNDVIEKQSSAKEGSAARAEMKTVGDTTVQDKAYVERAAALAIYNNQKEIYFENCKFIGRQDTLYGGTGVTAAFYDCAIYGGTDYIFGGMTAVFAKCDLVFNTSENSNDVGYITAPQQGKDQRGYLMYNCNVTSTVPGEDTASQYTSKAGYLGRPWAADTGEAVFYATIIDATCEQYFNATPSMIVAAGWLNTLSGESALAVEYDTYELALDVNTNEAVDNRAERAKWSGGSWRLDDLKQATTDGDDVAKARYAEALVKTDTETYLGEWDAFKGKDMSIKVPTKDDLVDHTPIANVKIKVLANLGVDENGMGKLRVSWENANRKAADSYELIVKENGAKDAIFSTTVENTGSGSSSVDIENLTINKTYEVSLTALRGEERGETDTQTKKVTKDAEVLIDPFYSLEDYIKEGLFAGRTYPGGFSVMDDMPLYNGSTTPSSKTVGDVTYDYWVQGNNNPLTAAGSSPSGSKIDDDNLPTSGAVLILDALQEGTAKFVCANEGKPICIVDVGGTLEKPVVNEIILQLQNQDYAVNAEYEFAVKKDHRYYIYARGSKIMLCAASVQYKGEVIPPLTDDPGSDVPADVPEEGLYVRLADGTDEYTYTGSAIKPTIEVYNNGELLVEGTDYTVKYKNNVKAGVKGDVKKSPSITVTGKGNLTGSNTTTFTIKQKDIDEDDVTVVDPLVIAQNTKATPAIYYNGVKLGAKDYKLSKTDKYTTSGEQDLTITGQGNYTGEKKITVNVVDKKDLKKLAVDVAKVNFTYDGTEKMLDEDSIKVYEKGDRSKTPLDESNYTIVYSNCVNAGTVKVTVIGQGYYTGSNVTKSYKINPIKAAATDFDVDGYEESIAFKSTGATFADLAVSYKTSGDTLVLGKDYKVSYSGNKKVSVGKAKVKITFLGNYKGSKAITKAFSITATPLEDLEEEVLVTSADKVYSGKPNTYVSKPIVTVGGVALKASDYTVKYYREDGTEINSKSKLTVTDDSATVEVRVSGKGNYASTNADAYVSGYYKVTVVSDAKTKDLSKAKVTFMVNGVKTTKLEYTGNPRTFDEDDETYDADKNKLEVKVEIKGVEVPASAYTVDFVNNVNKGKATAVINAVDGNDGGFGGGKTATYSIVSKNLKTLLDLFGIG